MDFLTPQIMHSRAARRRSSSRASRSTSSTSLLATRPRPCVCVCEREREREGEEEWIEALGRAWERLIPSDLCTLQTLFVEEGEDVHAARLAFPEARRLGLHHQRHQVHRLRRLQGAHSMTDNHDRKMRRCVEAKVRNCTQVVTWSCSHVSWLPHNIKTNK